MLTEVGSFLDRKEKKDFLGKLVLVSDHQASGSFFIHYFISQALKDDCTVYIVSFIQSFIHYSTIAAKLGVNLSQFQSNGRLVYVDCLTHLLDDVWAEPGSQQATPPSVSPASSTFSYTLDSDKTLKGLYKILHASLTHRTHLQGPVCIVLDDLSTLLSVRVQYRDIKNFVRYCHQFFTGSNPLTDGYVVAMVHHDSNPESFSRGVFGDEGELGSQLTLHSHMNLHVTGLSTGFSKDIHGEIKAEWRDPCPDPSFAMTTKHAQFKLSDRSITIFAKGTSRAVL